MPSRRRPTAKAFEDPNVSYQDPQPRYSQQPQYPGFPDYSSFPEEPGHSQPAWQQHSWQQPDDQRAEPVQPGGVRREVRALSAAYRRLRRVATLSALGYFVLFLVLSAYAPDLMAGHLAGGLSFGIVLGLLQLPVTLAAVAVYERTARRRVDPLAEAVRLHTEQSAQSQQGARR